jgi:lipoprotein NlpI
MSLVCALFVISVSSLAASGDELAQLFVELRQAANDEQAAVAERGIWQHWMQHADAGVNEQFAKGVWLLNNGEYAAAVQQFSLVVELDPEFSEAWNKRATAYFLMSEMSASVLDIERTLALEPRHFGALSGMGLIFLQLDDLSGALAAFEKVLVIHPRSGSARYYVQRLRHALKGKLT